MSPLLKNLTVALGIALVLFAAYFIFKGSDPSVIGVTGPNTNSEIWARSQQILSDTSTIDNYRMDVSVLSDRRFTSLVDTRTDLDEVTLGTGRANPFAPVE